MKEKILFSRNSKLLQMQDHTALEEEIHLRIYSLDPRQNLMQPKELRLFSTDPDLIMHDFSRILAAFI